MITLPQQLYQARQVRELDRLAIEKFGIPGATLMARAGAAAFATLRGHWPCAQAVAVLCGVGNNGGDGAVLAQLAHAAGLRVSVFQVGGAGKRCGDALNAAHALQAAGITPQAFSPAPDLTGFDVIVDALLGTGLDREATGEWRTAIDAINHSGVPVLAIDIPSGLHSDTGQVLGAAVRAQVTISFIGLKQGQFTAQGADYCGVIEFDDLHIPAAAYAHVPPAATRSAASALSALLPRRLHASHKGHYGHVLVIGGDHGMMGAARLAGEAALRTGSGLVSVATRTPHATAIATACPELMCHGTEHVHDLRLLLQRVNVIAIGPGLGQSAWARALLAAVLQTRLPLVVDADALNLLAHEPDRRDNWILTPHPAEAARLLGITTAQVQVNRFSAAQELQRRYAGVCVLKGAGSLVCAPPQPMVVCDAGNPGMASGGMGDVLTGIIAGLLAQGLNLADAARAGVDIHARAGDLAARDGERGLLASDLLLQVRRLVNPH